MTKTKKKTFLSSKKGNAFLDTLSIVIVLFIFGVLVVVGYNILSDVNDTIQADNDYQNATKQQVQTLTDNYPGFMDFAFLTALILFWVAAVVSSFLLDSHPIFMIISVLLLGFVLFAGATISNSFEELATDDIVNAGAFPIINWVISNLLLVVIFIGFSIILALYGKNRLGGGF